MNQVQIYISLFFIYSIIGWITEVFLVFLENKKVVNRGFLIGPYIPIYGIGGLLVTILLSNNISNPIFVFFESMIICGSIEYLISYIMEILFKARWWDYSHFRFNINGRVCLLNMILFGIGCIFLLYLINPFLIEKINLINSKTLYLINLILLTIFIFDFIVTSVILFKIKSKINFTSKDSTEEISDLVKRELLSAPLLTKRLVLSFPDLKVLYKRIREKFKE